MFTIEEYHERSDEYTRLCIELILMAHKELYDIKAVYKEFGIYYRTSQAITYFSTPEINRKAEETAIAFGQLIDCRIALTSQEVDVSKLYAEKISKLL